MGKIGTILCCDLSKQGLWKHKRSEEDIRCQGQGKPRGWMKQARLEPTLPKEGPGTQALTSLDHSACFSNPSIFSQEWNNVYFNINFKSYNNVKIYHLTCYAEFKSLSLFFQPILFVLFQLHLIHDQAVILVRIFIGFKVCTELL